MVFDECAAFPADEPAARAAMERTLRWARRGRDRFLAVRAGEVPEVRPITPAQAQFGIVQGGVFGGLREDSLAGTLEVGFDAYAIGGLSVGEPVETMYEIVAGVAPLLPPDRPRYLMGTGLPDDLIECVARGVDMFDCVLPTRNARNGTLFTSGGRVNIKRTNFARDSRPLDEKCECYTCRNFSRAYLRHLYMAGEILSSQLNSLHNLYFYHQLMKNCRELIRDGRFDLWTQ
jgi:queuine tRNA-ribosyltransferase